MDFKRIVIALTLIFKLTGANSQTGGELFASINVLEITVRNAINEVDDMISAQQRALYRNLLGYTESLMGNLKYLMDDLNRKLTDHEKSIFTEIQKIIFILKDESKSWQDKITQVTTDVENTVANTVFGNKIPRPTSYNIPVITTLQNKTITIDIRGVRLAHQKNHLVFKNRKIPVTAKESDRKLSFSVPLSNADIFDASAVNTFDLVLYKKSWLVFNKKYRYNPRFIVVPSEIGKVKVYYKVGYQEREEKTGYRDDVSATSGSRRTIDVHKQFNIRNSAGDGWKINKASIKCRKSSGNGKKHGYGYYANMTTDYSFVAKAYAKDGRAVCTCTWSEYRIVNRDSIQSNEITIAFKEQIVGLFPTNYIQFVKTEVVLTDGTKFESMDVYFRQHHLEFTLDHLKRQFQVSFAR